METRKLIKFGKNSFVITISPKWLEKNNVKKADLVYVTEEDGDLKIAADPKKDAFEDKTYLLDITGKNDRDIQREIVTAYINNFRTVEIKGEDIMKKSEQIREMLHNLVALEIMEQTSDKIIAKDFLDIENISIDSLVRKIDNIVRAMILDSRKSFDEDNTQNISLRDKDINRIVFLITRIIKEGLKNNRLRNTMNKSPLDLHYDWRLAKQIELIANDTKRISKVISELGKIEPGLKKRIDDIYAEIEDLYKEVMKATYKKDVPAAIKQAVRKNELMKKCGELTEKHPKSKGMPVLVEKFRNMVKNIHHTGQMIYT